MLQVDGSCPYLFCPCTSLEKQIWVRQSRNKKSEHILAADAVIWISVTSARINEVFICAAKNKKNNIPESIVQSLKRN